MLILVFSTIACLLGISIVTILHNLDWLDVVVHPQPAPSTAPLISVIVPARDEERNIRRCVECLLSQDYPNYELIVLDDRSTDATPTILATIARQDGRLHVLNGSELPAGWAGKPHALYQAARIAQGAWLCFVDADTFAAPQALSSVYAAAQACAADLFSIFTRQEMGSFWEKVILPLIFTALSVGFSPRKVNDPHRPDAIANGQFIFIRNSVYQALGGHAAIKSSIVEDRDLATLVKQAGYHLVVADGQAVASTRMYTSLSEMWEGWTKNIFLGLKGRPGLLLLGASGAFLSVFAALLLPLWLVGGLIWLGVGGGILAVIVAAEAALLWGFLVFWRKLACRRMGIPAWYALSTPLGSGVFAAMMIASAWKVLSRRGVTWKGRRYSSTRKG
jgi:chlorobactene glucosyltransferase